MNFFMSRTPIVESKNVLLYTDFRNTLATAKETFENGVRMKTEMQVSDGFYDCDTYARSSMWCVIEFPNHCCLFTMYVFSSD